MDILSFEDLTSTINKLMEETKCPMCLDVLCPPLCCCVNGHYICASCRKELLNCPTCRTNFIETHTLPTLVKNVLTLVPRKCKHSMKGCGCVLLPCSVDDHESVCTFRTVTCRINSCAWQDKADSLLKHIKEIHEDIYLFKTEESRCSYNLLMRNVDQTTISPVEGINCIFWMYFKEDNKRQKCLIFFVWVPTTCEAENDFYSVITFSKNNSPFKYSYTQKVFKENEHIEQIYAKENCIAVPLSEVTRFRNNTEEEVGWSFKIFRETETKIEVENTN